MQFKENTFIISLILFSVLGLNSVLSWGRSPAVSPILEVPHNFPTNVSTTGISGYDLSRSKVTSTITQTNNYVVPVMRTMDLFIVALGIFGLFGSIGFFYLGNKQEPERENHIADNVKILRPKSSNKSDQDTEDELKRAS